jgi:hypothetical protein
MVIVDVELRFVERMVPAADPRDARYVPRKILQSRKLERDEYGLQRWTEWQDVPLVKE